ncbi:hypothetical protein MBLNU457_g0414t1 [Dothideomycetes sp. NU457]
MAMQSIFRLPWGSDPLESRPDSVSAQKMRASPIMDIPLLNKLKRKRTSSPESPRSSTDQDVKRKKLAQGSQQPAHTTGKRDPNMVAQQSLEATTGKGQQPELSGSSNTMPPPQHIPSLPTTAVNPRSPSNDMAPQAVSNPSLANTTPVGPSLDTGSDLSLLQQTIEHSFNVEILAKHRELRLIDQEMAKCQVALEQLRRCELIPYPGLVGMSDEVSTGRGPSIRSQPGFTQPAAPAPWGVTDGPYTRHYRSWLLQDQTFDSTPILQTPAPYDGFAHRRADSRSTRNSIVSLDKPSKRGSRESISSITQPQANQVLTPPPRVKGAPLVIRRATDNVLVKLICIKCNRGGFSSVQGFLNHCRIAHKLEYKTHDAAALECGQPLGPDEQHLEPSTGSAAHPTKVQAPNKATSAAPTTVTNTASKVHQLNRPQPLNLPPRPTWKRQRLAYDRALSQVSTPVNGTPVTASPAASSFHSSPLVPSTSTPSLSKLFAKRGLGGDLQAATSTAREKVDLGPDNEDGDDDSNSKESPVTGPAGGARTITSNNLNNVSGGQQSTKGHRQPSQRPRPAPLSSGRSLNMADVPLQDNELSPHTADSNPGLVSDHDDDPTSDAEDDGHSVAGTSHSVPISRACGEAMDIDLQVDGEHDEHSVLVRARNNRNRENDRAGSPSRPRSRYDDSRK